MSAKITVRDRVLAVMQAQVGYIASELAARLDIHPHQARRALRQLKDAGLVRVTAKFGTPTTFVYEITDVVIPGASAGRTIGRCPMRSGIIMDRWPQLDPAIAAAMGAMVRIGR